MSTLRVLSEKLDLYAAPGTGSRIIARLQVGDRVVQLSLPDALGWSKIKRIHDGLVGWAYVYSLGPAPVTADRAERFEVTAELELRAGPDSAYASVATLNKDSIVLEQITPCHGWARVSVEDGGPVGWTLVEHLMPAPAVKQPSAPASQSATAAPTAQQAPAPVAQQGCCYRPSQQVLDSGGSALIFDVSHFQGDVDAAAARAAGLRAMIHKATEGTGFTDPKYAENRERARAAGLLWGAYHFGVGEDPQGQATYFLEQARPDGETLLVLDFEKNPGGASMSIEEARDFVSHLHDKTGKWPGVYGGSYLRDLLGDSKDPVLGNCWFWLAEYGTVHSIPPTWDYWTLWQYTDGRAGAAGLPRTVPGVREEHCDRDKFVGDAHELVTFWSACGV